MNSENQIEMYIHCALCLEEIKEDPSVSPKDYCRQETGWTRKGLQIWCARHDVNICNIDFEGFKHPAITNI